ncbi:hypothetical protein AB0J02_03040, partial [Streptomyces sp. NPDC050264]
SKGPDTKGPDTKGPDTKGPDTKGPDPKGPDTKASDPKGPDPKGPDPKSPDTKGPDTKGPDPKGPDTKASDPKGPDTNSPDTKGPDTKTPEPAKPTAHRSHTTAPWLPPTDSKAPRYKLDRDGVLTAPDGTTYTQGAPTGRGNGFFGALSTAMHHAAARPGTEPAEASRLRVHAGEPATRLMSISGLPGDRAERATLFTPPPMRPLEDGPEHSTEALDGNLRRHLAKALWGPTADQAMARWAAAAMNTAVTLIEENGTAHTYRGPTSDSTHLRLRRRGGDFVPLLSRGPAPEEEVRGLSTLSGADTNVNTPSEPPATPAPAAPVFIPFTSGNFEFTNLEHSDETYRDKALRVIEVLKQNATITEYLNGRRCRITLHVRTTETPADVIDRKANGVEIALASYYFEKYGIGHIVGMLAHEIGLHPLASGRGGIRDEEEMFRDFPLAVPGLSADREMSTKGAGDADHIMAAYSSSTRHRLYRDIVVGMAEGIHDGVQTGEGNNELTDITDLFDSFLMDLASIAVSNDHRLNAAKEPGNTAKVYNEYKNQLRDHLAATPERKALLSLLPSNKTMFGVFNDFKRIGTYVAFGNRGDSIQKEPPAGAG